MGCGAVLCDRGVHLCFHGCVKTALGRGWFWGHGHGLRPVSAGLRRRLCLQPPKSNGKGPELMLMGLIFEVDYHNLQD